MSSDLEKVEAVTLEQARHQILQKTHCLLVIYLDFPGGDAQELVRRGRARSMIVLAIGTGSRDAVLTMENGALGYLDMSDSPEEISTALADILAGKIYVSKRWQQAVLQGLHRLPKRGKKDSAVESFSPTERTIWELLAADFKTVEIAKSRGTSVKTIETHLKRMQLKSSCSLPELRQKAKLWKV